MERSQPTKRCAHEDTSDCKERQTYCYNNWKSRTLEYLFLEQSMLEQVDENTNRKRPQESC